MKPMALIPFQSKGVPDTDEAWVGRHAVLVPLTGPIAGLEQVEPRTQSLTGRWRQWIRAVRKAGWPGLPFLADREGVERVMSNCRPAFFDPDRPSRTCGCGIICPHCWARKAQQTWREVDLALFRDGKPRGDGNPWAQAQSLARRKAQMPIMQVRGLLYEGEISGHDFPSRSGPHQGGEIDGQSSRRRLEQHDLIERVVSYRVRREDADRHAGLTEHLQARYLGRSYEPGIIVGSKREHHGFQELGVAFGLDVIQVDLPRPPRGASGEGPVSAAEPARGQSEALMGHPSIAGAKGAVRCLVRRGQRPTRRRIMLAVARACRYPRTLLDCPPQAMEVIRARGFRVWATTFGDFMN
jgi:hypothetical protein